MKKTAVISFGRMNPPTSGHEKLVTKVKAEAKKASATPMIFLSHTQDKKKNPLTYDEKIKYTRKAFGPAIIKSKARTLIEVLKELDSKFDDIILVVGSDRIEEFKRLTEKYNGKEYTFNSISVTSAGERDPDADDVSGMSASKLRLLAQSGEEEQFMKGVPSALSKKDKKEMYDKLRSVLGITESVELEYSDEDFDISEEDLDIYVAVNDLSKLDEETEYDSDIMEFIDLTERKPLNVQQRMAIGRRMKRLQPKLRRTREIQKRKMADVGRLMKRAKKAAIQIIRKKFAGKQGQNYKQLSPSSKISVDKIIEKKKPLIAKLARRLLPKIRKKEQERLKSARSSKNEEYDFNEAFKSFLENDNTQAAKNRIAREKEADKKKHDAMMMMDRARTRDTQTKNRMTEDIISEGIIDDFKYKKLQTAAEESLAELENAIAQGEVRNVVFSNCKSRMNNYLEKLWDAFVDKYYLTQARAENPITRDKKVEDAYYHTASGHTHKKTVKNVQTHVKAFPEAKLDGAALIGISERISNALINAKPLIVKGRVIKEPSERKSVTRTLENTGHCSVCSQNVKLKNGKSIHTHGYTQPYQWQGARTTDCPGTGWPAIELSPDGLKNFIKRLKNNQTYITDQFNKLDPTTTTDVYKVKRKLERQLELISNDIKILSDRLSKWKAQPLPGKK